MKHTTYTKTLPNKLRILGINIPGTMAVTTLILTGAGSRHETKENNGISHFLEHMFFKGSQKYKTPKDVSMAVDSFGGTFNAFTGKEYAGYYIKSNKENFESSLHILSDMLLHPLLPPQEIEKERGVILEEMAMYQDAPMYQISWDFESLVFGDQPLGWDQIGSSENINRFTREDFIDYRDNHYSPDNTTIIIAGDISKADVDTAAEYFIFPDTTKSGDSKNFVPQNYKDRVFVRSKNTEQFHIIFGGESVSETHPDYYPSIVLATILGGNMSSRLFQSLREEQSLCYSIRTRIDEYSDAGLFITQAGVKKERALEAIKMIKQEYENIVQNGITTDELIMAKNYLCGKLDLSTEDSEEVAHQYGHNYLLFNSIETFQEQKNKFQAVTKKQVEDFATSIFHSKNYFVAGIGPKISKEDIETALLD